MVQLYVKSGPCTATRNSSMANKFEVGVGLGDIHDTRDNDKYCYILVMLTAYTFSFRTRSIFLENYLIFMSFVP